MIPAGFTHEYHVLTEICGSMNSGFLLLNQQQMIYSNASAQRLLRISNTDVLSAQDFDVRKHLLSIVAEPQQVHAALDHAWLHPEQEYCTDLALADAAVRWLRMHSFPVRDGRGNLLGRGILFDDITLERSILESRGETLALAAHELKTPLAIIKGCATTLLGSSARWDPAIQREMLQMIDTQSDRLHDILNTLLDVWRLDAGTQPLRMTQVYIPEMLEQLVRRWHKLATSHRFVLRIPPDLPPVLCDVVRIEQTLNHLLKNAVTYSPAGKMITIAAETDDGELRIAITDEGIGIALEHLSHIFDRFYRIQQDDDEQVGGTGLGLAAARAAVEAHGGKIWADSAGHRHGATFSFTLPIASHATSSLLPPAKALLPTAQQVIPSNTTRPALRKADRRIGILLAESDPRMARYIRANLEEQQYRVHTVNHGVQFLRQLDLEEPALIILSTRLADMSGIQLLQRLREFSPIPVIVLSDDCDEDERAQIFDCGGDDLMLKPFGMKELLAAIFCTGDLIIDHAQHIVTVRDKTVQLSRTEYNLLNVLAQNAGMVVTHELLLEKVWGPEYNRDVDFIWVYISRLRRKIEEDSRHPKYIVTVPDVGYKLMKIAPPSLI
ncbi:MAG: response regulator [Chloroflexi bacterium]|nr:MAG: response regulator [Chloroflexota bacterium]